MCGNSDNYTVEGGIGKSFFEGDFTANGQNYEYEINTVPGEIYIRVKDPIHKRTYENIVTLLENGKIEIAGWGDADNIDRELTEKELNKLSSFTFDFLTDFLSKNRDKKMDAMRGSGIFQK